jgi:hypothetical protein
VGGSLPDPCRCSPRAAWQHGPEDVRNCGAMWIRQRGAVFGHVPQSDGHHAEQLSAVCARVTA